MEEAATVVEAKVETLGPVALNELCQAEGPCLTIYLTGHRAGSGSRPRTVRLRHILGEAKAELDARGVAPTDRDALLEPLQALAAKGANGIDTGDAGTLALFRSPRVFRMFHLPWAVDDRFAVEGRFLVAPLVTGFAAARRFLLLALSRNNTRLLECGPDFVRGLELPGGLPASVTLFEGFDAPDHMERNRSSAGPGTGSMKAVAFGTGSEDHKRNRYLHDYCLAIHRELEPMLAARNVPLVVMGAAAELAAYTGARAASIEASPDGGYTDFELAEKGRAVMSTWLDKDTVAACAAFADAAPAKKSTELEEIIRAAAGGRVHHLFVSEAREPQTGDVDRIVGRTLMAGQVAHPSDDLANAAIVETIRHAGHVWATLPEGCPSVGALYRY